MTEPVLHPDFDDLLALFAAHDVRYLVVGAHALATHGVQRATGDLDLWVEPTTANAARVMAALAEFGAPLQAHGVAAEDFAAKDNVYQMGLPPRRIDILTSITAVEFPQAWTDRTYVEINGRNTPVAGRASLIQNKRATGRPRDMNDVIALLELSGEGSHRR